MNALNQRSMRANAPTPTASPPLIFVVDDDISVRESLRALLASEGWQVEIFASAGEFLATPRTLVASCLLLDVRLPGVDGLELQRRITADRPELPIIFITGEGTIPLSVRAMKAGAVEFLTKPVRASVLLPAIVAAIERSRTVLEREAAVTELRLRHARLTRRERDVLQCVIAGCANKEIGGRLGIREITVKVHRGRVMQKMRATSVPHLVTLAERLQLPLVPRTRVHEDDAR